MKIYFLIIMILISFIKADEIMLYKMKSHDGNVYGFFTTNESIGAIKKVTKKNFANMVSIEKALQSVEKSARYRTLNLSRSNISTINLQFISKNPSDKNISDAFLTEYAKYKIGYNTEDDIFYFNVLSNGNLLYKKKLK